MFARSVSRPAGTSANHGTAALLNALNLVRDDVHATASASALSLGSVASIHTRAASPAHCMQSKRSSDVSVGNNASTLDYYNVEMPPKGYIQQYLMDQAHDTSFAARQVATHLREFEARKKHIRHLAQANILPMVDPYRVHANNDVDMSQIEMIGFDYDYTLVDYTEELDQLIYELAKEHMVDVLGYPPSLMDCKFDPTYASRGLYYDRNTGNLMKLDFLKRMQPGTVYFGRQPLSREQLEATYDSLQISRFYFADHLRPMNDLFTIPEACLISDIIQSFVESNIDFAPSYILEDVQQAVESIHYTSLHSEIAKDISKYVVQNQGVVDLLVRWKRAGKKLFLLTNNKFQNVNAGMSHLTRSFLPPEYADWRELFDYIMCSADKPEWYRGKRPFRMLDRYTGRINWRKIDRLQQGEVYVHGSLSWFHSLVGVNPRNILYIGDNLAADLEEATAILGWNTCVIIREMEREIHVQNTPQYRQILLSFLEAQKMLSRVGKHMNKDSAFFGNLQKELAWYRRMIKELINPHFGSIFRTHNHSTMLAYHIQEYADVYTSSLQNFTKYSDTHLFYAQRKYLPHEEIFVTFDSSMGALLEEDELPDNDENPFERE